MGKNASIGNSLINARAETLTVKPSFQDLLKKSRCLVVAHGFYEWLGKAKFRCGIKSGAPVALAGLRDSWRKPDGAFLHSYTIVTTESNELLRPIHNRMPAILNDEDALMWLSSDGGEIAHALSLLKPYPTGEMKGYEAHWIWYGTGSRHLIHKPFSSAPHSAEFQSAVLRRPLGWWH